MLSIIQLNSSAQVLSDESSTITFSNPAELVDSLYQMISFPKEEVPNWSMVRPLFLEECVITLRMSSDSSAIFTVEEWIQDFKDFIINKDVELTGFEENVLKMSTTICGDIAQIAVLYEAKRPGESSGREGIDFFHLLNTKSGWKIVSILNEIPRKNVPKPKCLSD